MMKILVIGDIIKDRYIYGSMSRLNPESPAPLVKVNGEKIMVGGAGNVWNNLKSLGIEADLVDYDEEFQCTKTRVICDGHYVTRFDEEKTVSGSYILEKVKRLNLNDYTYVILSDYNKGALDQIGEIIEIVGADKIIVDPKREIALYRNAWLIKANEMEDKNFKIQETWQSNYIITHAGGEVVSRFEGNIYKSSPHEVDVVDVTGAGDCFIAAFTYGLVNGYEWQKCINIATRAATISVQHTGTYILQPEDVEEITVFTNGCFDVLHRGHIEYLTQSRRLGNKLVVGLNSDASVTRLKGSSRPINTEQDRKLALEALRCVDKVIIFNENTPSALIDEIKPDIITKGGDYNPDQVIGNDRAKIVVLPFVDGFSSTKIIGKL